MERKGKGRTGSRVVESGNSPGTSGQCRQSSGTVRCSKIGGGQWTSSPQDTRVSIIELLYCPSGGLSAFELGCRDGQGLELEEESTTLHVVGRCGGSQAGRCCWETGVGMGGEASRAWVGS